MKKTESYDVVIVGAGIAGLSFSLYLVEANPKLRILILSKGRLPESNTRLAQGGIAAVTDHKNDTFSSHIQDTIQSGRGLSNEYIVESVVYEAPDRMKDLMRWGVSFDATPAGFHLNREGGHSAHRILHHKDFTGREIHQKLLQKVKDTPAIRVKENCFAIDLTIVDNQCRGLCYLDEQTGEQFLMETKAVMLATGGSGQMFPFTTNEHCATGDGVAIAARAGAMISDLCYYQFHPTAMYLPGKQQRFLISEAVRGHGAFVVNSQGRRFLFDHDTRGELATRDIVTNAIFQEMQQTGAKCVYLSVKHLDIADVAEHFPTIWQQCENAGIDLSKDDIPIIPAAHYQCGGIAVNEYGQTTVDQLYAGGECARTGLHGANRLASNSLLEALVFSYRSAKDISGNPLLWNTSKKTLSGPDLPEEKKSLPVDLTQKRHQLQELMNSAFHQKNKTVKQLRAALKQVSTWEAEFEASDYTINKETGEYRNLLKNGILVIESLINKLQTELQSIPI